MARSRKPEPSTRRSRVTREVRGYAEALLVAYLVITFGFTTVGVAGTSMEPNLNGGEQGDSLIASLLKGDRVFIPKFDTWLRRAGLRPGYDRGTIVVLREPANAPNTLLTRSRSFFIKRIIGVPGDHVRIEAGQVYVNDRRLDQGFITETGAIRIAEEDFPKVTVKDGVITEVYVGFRPLPDRAFAPVLPLRQESPQPVPANDPRVEFFYGTLLANVQVPPGAPENTPLVLDFVVPEASYFVMGDNRNRFGSEDSRYFGSVDAMAIAGQATAVIWPPRRNGAWNLRPLPAPTTFADLGTPTR